MWDLDHNTLPSSLSSYFTKRRNDHTHLTRMATSDKLSIHQFNTNRYGQKSFQIQGALVLNKLKEQELYNTARTKQVFLKKIKESFLVSY